jgi:putative ribosome biogenesis GTPase RsgA
MLRSRPGTDLRRGAVHEHDADVERPQERHIQQQRRKVVVGDDVAVERENEGLLSKLRDVLQDAAEVSEFHFNSSAILIAHYRHVVIRR